MVLAGLKISDKCVIFEADFALALQVVIPSVRVGSTEAGGLVPLHSGVASSDLPDLENTNSRSACVLKAIIPTFQEKVERVNSSLRRQTKSVASAVGIAPSANTEENADERSGRKPKKKSRSRGRSNSYDSDSLSGD